MPGEPREPKDETDDTSRAADPHPAPEAPRTPPSTSAPASDPASPSHSGGDNFVYNNFYGPQYQGRVHFGIAGADERPGRASATGWLEGDEIDALLRSYVRPDCFDEAARELARTRVVVLTGPHGTGKRSGAVALLRETVGPSAEYVVLSPDLDLDQLAGRPFKEGFGYVILDRTGIAGTAGDPSADFDWRRVRDQLHNCRAHLVITTVHGVTGRPPEAVRHLAWQPPALDKVVRARLFHPGIASETVDRAVAGIPSGCPVGVVAEAAQRIADGADPDQTWKEHSGSAPQAVQDWFGAEEERSLREIAEVTTLAFAYAVGRRDFESLQNQLEQSLEPVYFTPDPAPAAETAGAPGAVGQESALRRGRPADRRRSLARNILIGTENQVYGSTTREVMVFADSDMRRWVLRALWRDHPTEYWDAVRSWLETVVAAGPDPGLQLSIASGLALLGDTAFDEVVQSYLDPWARGEAGETGQTIAVWVLWWMCLDKTQAAAALTLARTWAQSTHPALRGTALSVFGGQLGVTFPSDAVKWLWAVLRSGVLEKTEQRALGLRAWAQLFLAFVERREDAGIVLDALAGRIGKERRTRAAAYSATGLLALETTLWVFTVAEPFSGRPAVARYLVERPNETEIVAELWAALLCYRPMRREAQSALLVTLRALPAVTSDPTAVAERLSHALAAALPPVEPSLLVSEVGRLAASRHARATDSDCVAILLGALNRAKDSHPR
ncbi:hypothetical protein ACFVIY_13235 [Streptomyces sp. NPDC127166]|uniref:hypothetical protein n=1 Tax=Streptomyces sp. NPDC127166 TaxID=3345380 RepID=UPI00362FCA48